MKNMIFIFCGIVSCASVAAQVQQFEVAFPSPVAFYDLDGDGEKEFVYMSNYSDKLQFYDGISQSFVLLPEKEQIVDYMQYGEVVGISDVNGDGIVDIALYSEENYGRNVQNTVVSNGSAHEVKRMLVYPLWDADGDGAAEAVEDKGGYYLIWKHLVDGVWKSWQMDLWAYEDYQGDFDSASWMEMQESAAVGKNPAGDSRRILTGAALEPSSAPVPISSPDVTIDLNRDGYVDLLETASGTLYYGTPEGNYVVSTVGGTVVAKDLNGDDIVDYIVYGGELNEVKTLLYEGGGEFREETLIDNLAADNPVWCYDFDKDGDVDILLTFSSLNTDGETCYTLFFENDGTGNFTRHEEYQEHRWQYSLCRDVDNDGYYDLLLFSYDNPVPANIQYDDYEVQVMLRRGNGNLSFGEAEELFSVTTTYYNALRPDYPDYAALSHWSIHAEDLDNDGYAEVWLSASPDFNSLPMPASVAKVPGRVNTLPAAPTGLRADYRPSTGKLILSWNAATDAESSSKDLTYAIRIGSQPGQDDKVKGYAHADGRRENFVDGNAGSFLGRELDIRSWKPGTYYVSVQAVDPNHAGSPWSDEISFVHTYLPVDFTMSATQISTVDTLTVYYTYDDRLAYSWDAGDGTVVSDEQGKACIEWNTAGYKVLTLVVTAADGTTARSSQTVNVLANHVGLGEYTPFVTENIASQRNFYDYDNDGLTDFVKGDGLYKNNGDGTFGKAKGIFNQGLDIMYSRWIDMNMDGLADLLYNIYDTQVGRYSIGGMLENEENGNFSKNSSPDITVIGSDGGDNGKYMLVSEAIDLDNDGFVDFISDNNYVYRNEDNRTFTQTKMKDMYMSSVYIDWDRDGLWDNVGELQRNGSDYTALTVYRNKGNFEFETLTIPIEEPVTSEWNYNLHLEPILSDLNGDGYLDMVFFQDKHTVLVLYNEENLRFVPGFEIAMGDDVTDIPMPTECCLFDMDNNGYEDIFFFAYNKLQQDSVGLYGVFIDAQGVYNRGFVTPGIRYHNSIAMATLANGEAPEVYAGYTTNDASYLYMADNRTKATNTPPQAPAMVTAVQTDNSLLIEWNPAADAETPPSKLRYNLSVKKKGASGDDSYIISPFNAGSHTTGPLLGGISSSATGCLMTSYYYPVATRYEIPVDRLPVGELEIQVQTIDLWGETSGFSAPVTVKIENRPLLEAPRSVCFGEVATIAYKGTVAEGVVPEWDFAGGEVLSGSGYGPYDVVWASEGVKQVTIDVAGAESMVNIVVQPDYNAAFTLPERVFYNADFTIALPEVPRNATFAWSLSGEDREGEDIEVEGEPGMMRATARIVGHPELAERTLTLTVGLNGCTKVHRCVLQVLPELAPPVLTLVESEGTSNVVTWNAAWMDADCSDIVIYKEGAYLNDFIEIGRVPKAQGRFVDMVSDNTVCSERYAIAMLMNDGTISPMSDIHQTVLLTINRGMTAGCYNLIWNGYVGREIASYRILRGASPDALHEIATLSGAATSYVDEAVDAEPYYSLEIIPEENYYPDASGYRRVAAGDERTRSNVVYSGDARDITYIEQLRILTVGNIYELTAENPVVYLYAEILPVTASHAQVVWEVVSGEEFASVDAYGRVTAKNNSNDGTVTIMATAVDGSGVTAYISLDVEKNSGVEIPAMSYAEVKAYPVPVRDVLHVSSRVAIERLQLIDMQGRVAKDIRGNNRMLDVSRIPQGTYLLRVELSDGSAVSLKIVKK